MQSVSTPSDFILQTFNAFNPEIAQSPTQILNNLNNYVNVNGVNHDPNLPNLQDQITTQTSEQQFTSSFTETSSAEVTQTNLAVSSAYLAAMASTVVPCRLATTTTPTNRRRPAAVTSV